MHYYTSMKLAALELYIIASDLGITHIEFADKHIEEMKPHMKRKSGTDPVFHGLPMQLKEYFSGKRQTFEVPIDLTGTEFQIKVWQALLDVPFGKTISYSGLAKKVKNPKGARAIGNAVGDNPIPIIIPCHRVIKADGTIGGYSGGIETKKILMKIENIHYK